MKTIRILLIGICSFFTVVSCTEDFVEINTNPSEIIVPPMGAFFNQITQNPLRNYQRNINLYPDFFAQYWANGVDGFKSPKYEYVNGWIGNMWREFYVKTLAQAIAVKGIYKENPAYKNALAQLEIWMCSEWARMLQIYGDIPYFGAGEGKSVPFNSEQEIYNDLFSRLDAAVRAIDAGDASQISLETSDLIYEGDFEKWKRFGNSVRLRLAMRLSNIDPAKAQTEALAAINLGVMINNDDVAQIPIDISNPQRGSDYLNVISNNFNNIRVSETFINYLYSEANFEDPRASKWLAYNESSPLIGGRFIGLKNGLDAPQEIFEQFATMKTSELGGEYEGFIGDGGATSAYMPIVFYSEVLFLQAEAALRGWVPGDANSLYQQGIQASMDLLGVDPTDASAYIAAVPSLAGANETSLKQLIIQKYIANFPNGSESWADFRRTDYPDITLPVDGVSGNASVTSGTWVKRVRYPDNAHLFESESMPVSRNTIPLDRMDIRLWWDTADTKTKSGGLMSSNF